MKIEWNKKYTTIAVYSFLTLAAALFFIYFLTNFAIVSKRFKDFLRLLAPILYGIAIAYVLNPMLDFIEDNIVSRIFKNIKPKPKRNLSILLTYLFALFIISIFFWIVIPEVGVSISNLTNQTLTFVNNIEFYVEKINSIIPFHELPEDLIYGFMENIKSFLLNIYQFISSAVPYILNMTVKFSTGLLNFILGIIISVYIFSSKELFFAQTKKLLYSLTKKERVDFIIELTHEGNDIFSGFISGKILDSIIIGVICFAGMSLLKIPSAMLVSLIVGVTNIIPYFGPFIGAIPSALIILVENPYKAFIFVIFILVLQQFDGNVLGPKILGDSTGLSAFWVIFAILIFGGSMGVLGMFIGVPTFAVIYNGISRYINYRLEKKNMSTNTPDYASDQNKLL